MINYIARKHVIIDFALHDADIEDIIKKIYSTSGAESGPSADDVS